MSWLLEQLRKNRDNRGMMADLRCGLVPAKRHRAWPALSRLGIAITDEVSTLVAALYAMHPEEAHQGNFGKTCKAIETSRGDGSTKNKDARLTPTERRFQHLLAAEQGEELHQRLTRLVMAAKAQNSPINYAKLETDLKSWRGASDRTRTEWAATFWGPDEDPVSSTVGEEEGA